MPPERPQTGVEREARVATAAESYTVRRSAAKVPISAHPAFPAIVALWFAALLGLGSLVLPIALLEKGVTVSGLAALVPSAAPPLGFTARAGIALGGAIVGALAGLVLARKVARSQTPESATRGVARVRDRECRPISAHDELGEEGLAMSEPAPVRHKRRSLAMAEENRPSDYLQPVPVPGYAGEDRSTVATLAEEPADESDRIEIAEQPFEAEQDLLELGAFAETVDPEGDEAPVIETEAGLESLRLRVRTPDAAVQQETAMTDRPIFASPAPSLETDADRAEFRPERSPVREGLPSAGADDEDPLPFAAPSLRRGEPGWENPEDAAPAPEQGFGPKELEDADTSRFDTMPQLTVVAPADEGSADDDRPLDQLGLVQLAARLGASLEKRRAHIAQRHDATAAVPAAVPPLANAGDFEAAEADDAARAIADFFGPSATAMPQAMADLAVEAESELMDREGEAEPPASSIPAPLRSFALDLDEGEEEEDAFAASFSLPLASKRAAFAPLAEDEDGEPEDEDDDGDEYSSLLAMKNPFVRHQEFVRVEEPESDDGIEPTVTFPSAPPMKPAAADPLSGVGSAARPFDPPGAPDESAVSRGHADVPRDPADAARSLRDALTTLQRMSGAA
jgi:hypothetical protein